MQTQAGSQLLLLKIAITKNILGIISGNWTQKKCRHVDEQRKACCVKNKSQKAIKKATFYIQTNPVYCHMHNHTHYNIKWHQYDRNVWLLDTLKMKCYYRQKQNCYFAVCLLLLKPKVRNYFTDIQNTDQNSVPNFI